MVPENVAHLAFGKLSKSLFHKKIPVQVNNSIFVRNQKSLL